MKEEKVERKIQIPERAMDRLKISFQAGFELPPPFYKLWVSKNERKIMITKTVTFVTVLQTIIFLPKRRKKKKSHKPDKKIAKMKPTKGR